MPPNELPPAHFKHSGYIPFGCKQPTFFSSACERDGHSYHLTVFARHHLLRITSLLHQTRLYLLQLLLIQPP